MKHQTLLLLCLLAIRPAAAEWKPVTITNPDLRAKGVLTGDGAQIVRAVAIDHADGRFMLWCTDVGGLFRSLDGGKTWEPTNVGFHSRGSASAAIDPHNPERAIVIAANSVGHPFNGIYLTDDQAASWRLVMPVEQAGAKDRGRRAVAFDPATYDAEAGFTRVAYWSRLEQDRGVSNWWNGESKPALYKTADGGSSWHEVEGGAFAAGAHLAVHPANGTLYAGNHNGVLRSRDGGRSWDVLLEGPVTGMDISRKAPERIYATRTDSVWRSDDGGLTWERLDQIEKFLLPEGDLKHITVSPVDPDRLILLQFDSTHHFPRFYSHDGGRSWAKSTSVRGFTLLPSNSRWGGFAFHPTDPDLILAPGGDYPALSRDGGKTFAWAGNGVNNLMVGSSFSFSALDPDIVFLGSQDYATVLTTDGGENWCYFAPAGKSWGGFNYGAYAHTAENLVVAETDGWASPRHVAYSTDGGANWTITEKVMARPAVSYGDPKDPDTLFASQYRSVDGGRTWDVMQGATHVFTHDYKTCDLVGMRRLDPGDHRGGPCAIVRSADGGLTWEEVFAVEGAVSDIAFDPHRQRYYVIEANKLLVWENGSLRGLMNIPHDQEGYPVLRSVAVDTVNPAIVYLASARNRFSTTTAAMRSLDAGMSWEILTVDQPLDGSTFDGGREATWVRVNPRTREPWFITGCYGVWKYSAPVD